jgi:two-component system, cell cycle sensor histidine kinase and response regulator CckA
MSPEPEAPEPRAGQGRDESGSAELFRLLVQNSNDIIEVVDENGVRAFVGGSTKHMLGYDPAELVGRPAGDIVHPDDARKVSAALARNLHIGGVRITLEFRMRHKDGHWVNMEAVGTSLVDDPAVRGFILNIHDITQIKATQERLAESDVKYRSIVEASPMGIHSYLLEADGRLVLTGANPAADRILGISHRELVGKTIEEAFPPLAGSEIPERYREAAEHGAAWTTSQVNYDDDRIRGAYDVFAFQTSPRHMAVMFLDVTERLVAEDDKRRLESQLAQAQRLESVGRLAGGVAHDFNNLLTGIMGTVSLALMDLAQEDPLHENLSEVQRAAESAATLTKQLLTFSRRQIIEPRVLDLNEAVRQSHRMIGRLIGEDIDLRFLPGDHVGNVRIDPGQVEQVLVNLAVNSRDAMPKGGRLTIETTNVTLDDEYCARHATALGGAHVALAVSDTGTGMTSEVKAHVFEPFFSTKARGKGTGLGLATVFGIVKQNNGSIEVYSELGLGTTFKIYLPRVDAKAEPLVRAAVEAMPRGTETVYLVEDEEIVKNLAERVLRRQGYTVFAFPNGGEALMALQRTSEPVHLLVTDVVLPGINGKALAEQARALRPDIKVLFSSGYTEDMVAHHGILEAGLAFLGKPYSPQALARKVRDVLDGNHRRT